MATRTLSTKHGIIRIDDPDEEALELLKMWPKPILDLRECGRDCWGIAMKDSSGELEGLFVGYGYYKNRKDAASVLAMQMLFAPLVVGTYVKYGFEGILLPCGYMRDPDTDYVTTGYALFGRSCSSSSAGHGFGSVDGYEDTSGSTFSWQRERSSTSDGTLTRTARAGTSFGREGRKESSIFPLSGFP